MAQRDLPVSFTVVGFSPNPPPGGTVLQRSAFSSTRDSGSLCSHQVFGVPRRSLDRTREKKHRNTTTNKRGFFLRLCQGGCVEDRFLRSCPRGPPPPDCAHSDSFSCPLWCRGTQTQTPKHIYYTLLATPVKSNAIRYGHKSYFFSKTLWSLQIT